MRIRTVLCATVLATVAALPLAGVASAQPQPTDRDCRDFASQAAAQSALRSHSGDPQRLDSDHNGIACEDYFRTGQAGPAERRRRSPPSRWWTPRRSPASSSHRPGPRPTLRCGPCPSTRSW